MSAQALINGLGPESYCDRCIEVGCACLAFATKELPSQRLMVRQNRITTVVEPCKNFQSASVKNGAAK
jgi:hypothetical protein